MQDTWRKYASMRAPRYTSYPSALHFQEKLNPDRVIDKLKTIDLYEPLSVYVHIPFCRQLCWYCGCNMRVENNYQRALGYVDALLDEIRIVGGFLSGNGRPVSVHFGGGTPNYLSPEDLGRILNTIELELGLTDDAGLAIELDPRLVRKDDIMSLAAQGFSRMSMGVQDLEPAVQQAINRVQSYDVVEAGVSAMRQAGVNDISFDLLFGLPKQTANSFAATIAKTIALAPDRVSVFGYAHLPAALPRQRLIKSDDLPDEALRRDLAAIADDMLTSAGYQKVGFDHYAKPDNALAVAAREQRLRRNFQGFTDDVAETTIGFGATAIGFVNGLYTQNEKDVRAYCEAVKERRLPAARGVERTKRDQAVAEAISALLCCFTTDLAPVLSLTSASDVTRIESNLDALESDGVICRDGTIITMRENARSLSRTVAAAFDPYIYTQKTIAQAI
ncbi:MAG: oxygen-independent coproporphyrinogen III oxidase [Pseudomonadota bacterium]